MAPRKGANIRSGTRSCQETLMPRTTYVRSDAQERARSHCNKRLGQLRAHARDPPISWAAVHRTRNTDTLPPRQTCAAYDNRRATAEKGKPIARWGRKASGPGTSQDSGVAGPDRVSTRDARLVVIPPLSEPVKDRTAHRVVTIRSVNGARARVPPDGKDAGEWLG